MKTLNEKIKIYERMGFSVYCRVSGKPSFNKNSNTGRVAVRLGKHFAHTVDILVIVGPKCRSGGNRCAIMYRPSGNPTKVIN